MSEILHQLSLVFYPTIYRFYTSQVVAWISSINSSAMPIGQYSEKLGR